MRLAVATALALAGGGPGCGGDDGSGPDPTPTAMAIVSGDNQSGIVGTTLADPLVIRVEDGAGDSLAGATVNWTVVTGGGTPGATTSTTAANGQAQTQFTLGPNPGPNEVTASVEGTTLEVTFTATGQQPPPDVTPASLVIVSGNNQSAAAGTMLAESLMVQVKNASGSSLRDIFVTWTVTAGGGTLAAASGLTDGDGTATNSYTVGSSPGPNTVTASVVGTRLLTVTFQASATTSITGAAVGCAAPSPSTTGGTPCADISPSPPSRSPWAPAPTAPEPTRTPSR